MQHDLFSPYYEQTVTWNKCDKFITSEVTRKSIDDINNYRCTYINAPLNWNGDKIDNIAPDYSVKDNAFDSENQATIKLAVAMQVNNKTNTEYLFTNPGGPGGSGVQMILNDSHHFSDALAGQFNFASWDPRGVGLSTATKCYNSDEEQIIDIYKNIPGSMPDNYEAVRADVKTLADHCKELTGSLLKYVDTISTARDMDLLRYVLTNDLVSRVSVSTNSTDSNNAQNDKNYKLNYLGYSYGTKIGEAYSVLFSDQIGHMVLDGILDPTNSISDTGIAQTKGFQKVYEEYVNACLGGQIEGAPCPFTGKDAKYISDWIIASKKVFKNKPQTILSDKSREFNDNVFMTGIIMPLYGKENWVYLNVALTMLKVNNDNSILTLLADMYNDYESGKFTNNGQESYISIACSDTSEEFNLDKWSKGFIEAQSISPVLGENIFSTEGIYCDQLPTSSMPTNLNYFYNLEGNDNVEKLLNTKTNAKVLLLSNTNDPATPFESAEKVLQLLPNASLLTREDDQHCAYPNGDDKFRDAVDQYFIKDIMPENAKKSTASDNNNDNQG